MGKKKCLGGKVIFDQFGCPTCRLTVAFSPWAAAAGYFFAHFFTSFFFWEGPSPFNFTLSYYLFTVLTTFLDHFGAHQRIWAKRPWISPYRTRRPRLKIIYKLSSCGFSRCCRRCHHYKMSIKQKTFCQAYLKKKLLLFCVPFPEKYIMLIIHFFYKKKVYF